MKTAYMWVAGPRHAARKVYRLLIAMAAIMAVGFAHSMIAFACTHYVGSGRVWFPAWSHRSTLAS